MSSRASDWAYQQHDLPTGMKFTLVALADEADDDGVVWIGGKNVAGKVDKSRSAVTRHVKWMKDNGLIVISTQYGLDGQQARNLYRLQLHLYWAEGGLTQNRAGLTQNRAGPPQNGTEPLTQNRPTPDPKQATGAPNQGTSSPLPSGNPPTLQDDKEEVEDEEIEISVEFKGPEWWRTLLSIGATGDKRLKEASGQYGRGLQWLDRRGITEDHAERTAIDLKAKWGGKGWKFHDVWATFQKWAMHSAPEAAPPAPADRQQLVDVETIDGAKDVWSQALDILRGQVTRPAYQTWLANTIGVGYGQGGQVLVIGAPSAFARDQLDQRMYGVMCQAVQDVVGREIEIQIQEIVDAT